MYTENLRLEVTLVPQLGCSSVPDHLLVKTMQTATPTIPPSIYNVHLYILWELIREMRGDNKHGSKNINTFNCFVNEQIFLMFIDIRNITQGTGVEINRILHHVHAVCSVENILKGKLS